MSGPRTIEEALASLKGISVDEYRREKEFKNEIRTRGESFRNKPPSEWPKLTFNWDYTKAAQCHVYDGMSIDKFDQYYPEGLMAGTVNLTEFDIRLTRFNRRDDINDLWKLGNPSKLCYVLAYLEKGLPITPPLVSVANEELCLSGGNHRYAAAKFSGQMQLPIYVVHADLKLVETLVQVT
jgi:hypothetical protein